MPDTCKWKFSDYAKLHYYQEQKCSSHIWRSNCYALFWRVIDVKTSFTQTLVIESWQNHEWALRFFKRKCKLFLSKYKLCATQRFRRWEKPNFSWTWPNKLMQRGKWLQIIIVYNFSISVTEYQQLFWTENNHNCVMTNLQKITIIILRHTMF